MTTEVATKRKHFAEKLIEAEETLIGTSPLTSVEPELTVEEAYYIQLENIEQKSSTRSERLLARKSA